MGGAPWSREGLFNLELQGSSCLPFKSYLSAWTAVHFFNVSLLMGDKVGIPIGLYRGLQ